MFILESGCESADLFAGRWTADMWQAFLENSNADADLAGWDSPNRISELTARLAVPQGMMRTPIWSADNPDGIPPKILHLGSRVVTYGDLHDAATGVTAHPDAIAAVGERELFVWLDPSSPCPPAELAAKRAPDCELRLTVAVSDRGETHALIAMRDGDHSSRVLELGRVDGVQGDIQELEELLRRFLGLIPSV